MQCNDSDLIALFGSKTISAPDEIEYGSYRYVTQNGDWELAVHFDVYENTFFAYLDCNEISVISVNYTEVTELKRKNRNLEVFRQGERVVTIGFEDGFSIVVTD